MPSKLVLLPLLAAASLAAAALAGPAPVAGAWLKDLRLDGMAYRALGPSRGGRVTAVAGHRAQPRTFYLGASGGGVWKTTDAGRRWANVSDGFFATGSIGAIRVADSDPNVVYVATGSDGIRSNVIVGKGVYRSTDAGKTWAHVGLEKTGNSGALLVHPANPDLAYVAAIGNPFAPNPERGVFRTTDGGASWQKVLFVSDKTGAVDLEFAPDDPRQVYATLWRVERKPWTILSGDDRESGVYKSDDGGDTWRPLSSGLPGGLRGKADLAVTPADPKRVYVLIEAPGKQGGLYRSDDRGASWSQVTDFQPIRNRPFYYTNLEAHPKDPDVLWAMAEGFWKSEDAGKTWKRQGAPHGDHHDMWVNPDQPDVFIESNDGGANVTLDGGRSWSSQLNQPTAELYQVDVSDDFPYRLYAGQQDSTTVSVPSRPPREMPGGQTAQWEEHGGCETGPVVPKPGDPDVVYAGCKGRFGVYNRRTGQEQQHYVGFENLYGANPRDLEYRFQRVAPIHVSPHDPNRVYTGSQYLHATDDGGLTWRTLSPDLTAKSPETQMVSGGPITIDSTGEEHFAVLYAIQESPHERGVIWVGANDGPIHLTRDGGKSWQDVTPKGLPPHGRVQTLEVSPHAPGTAYACVLRYQLGDFAPYAFRTTDYGASWTRLTSGRNGIPEDDPVRVVREDPVRAGLLYAGTESRLYVSLDDGGSWQPLQLNLPVTPVTDLKLVGSDLALSTMGRGFWLLDDVTPLRELTPGVAKELAHLFTSAPAYRLPGTGFQEFPRAPEPDDPQYPPGGANIHYLLGEEPSSELRLEIRDPHGRVVRVMSSEDASPVPAPEPGGPAPALEAAATPRLPRTRGLHRVVWDLRAAGPWDAREARAGRQGPMLPPGRYEARLTIGSWSRSVPVDVRLDPRVGKEGIAVADVSAQWELAEQVRDALSAARGLAARLDAASRAAASGSQRAARIDAIREQLVTGEVRYSRPMLVDQLEYLYENLIRADQRPGRDAYERARALRGRLDDQLRAFRQLP